jgi:hypothetical protein
MVDQIKTPWRDDARQIHRPGATPVSVRARHAVYEFRDRSGFLWEVPVESIVEPQSRRIWIGPESDFYLIRETGLVGGRLVLGGRLVWCRAFLTSQGSEDEAVARFGREIDTDAVINRQDEAINLHILLNPWFFAAAPFSSQPAEAKIETVDATAGDLRLDLDSPTGEFKANIWIDPTVLQVVRIVENGTLTFPK